MKWKERHPNLLALIQSAVGLLVGNLLGYLIWFLPDIQAGEWPLPTGPFLQVTATLWGVFVLVVSFFAWDIHKHPVVYCQICGIKFGPGIYHNAMLHGIADIQPGLKNRFCRLCGADGAKNEPHTCSGKVS